MAPCMRAFPASAIALVLAAQIPANAATRVGVTAAVNPDATSHTSGQGIKTISLGDEVVRDQRIDTTGEGLVQILLADGTTFTVGPNSSLTIDSFVYDPEASTAKVTASLSKGFMRFIGGRTSKTEGGATINTPIGTAGIRGAVVDIDLGGAATPAHVSLIFGDNVIITANGSSSRLFQAGYSLIVEGGQRSVARTPTSFLAAMQDRLAGRAGATGGATQPPQDEQVSQSGVSQQNSDASLIANLPIPQPRPAFVPEENVAGQAKSEQVEEAATGGVPGGSVGQGPQPVTRTAQVRVLTARADEDGGGNGIVGGSPETDRSGELVGEEGRNGRLTLNDGQSLSLPVFADGEFMQRSVSGITYSGSTFAGNAYIGTDGFRAYMLSDGDNPLYVVSGTPSADPVQVFSSGGIRHYQLSVDPLGQLLDGSGRAIPFAHGGRLSPLDFSGSASSDLLVGGVSNGGDPTVIARALQSWIVIDGTGSAQRSAIGVMSGAVELSGDGSSYAVRGQRGGSDRLNGQIDPIAYRGTVASVAGGSGGGSLFGDNGQYLVLTNDLTDPSSSFADAPMEFEEEPERFSTGHVGNLVSTDTGTSHNYDGKSLSGYTAIALAINGFTRELKAGTAEMDFDASSGTFSATFFQFDDDENSSNDEIGFTDGYGGAVYLDDKTFASAGSNNRAYAVSADVAPVKIFQGGTSSQLCTCSYLSWGWWGRTGEGDGFQISGHMGNWVVGEVTPDIEMPASGTATYAGNAVGSVLSNGSQYVATGRMSASMDFSARTGNVTINDFDGRDFGSAVSFGGSSTFTGTNGDTKITGSFFDGAGMPAKGVAGAFSAKDGATWSSSGIFAGDRQ